MFGLRAIAALVCLLLLSAGAWAQDDPQTVRVGFYVTSISDIDFADGSFAIGAYAWFVHQAPDYDPTSQIAISARK